MKKSLVSYGLFFFIFSLFNTINGQTIGGEYPYLEPALKGRPDVLFYGAFESSAWTAQWGNTGSNLTVNTSGFNGNALNVFLQSGLIGNSGSGTTSLVYFLKSSPGVPALHEEMFFRYYVYLDPAFDYGQGGKIPGMCASASNMWGGGTHPDGSNGWSARYMWNKIGELYLYAYLPQAAGWGTDIYCSYGGKRATLTKGNWHCIEQYIKLNSFTGSTHNTDGKCYTWLDGNLCLKEEGLLYRTVLNDAGKEFGTYFACFFGGGDADWAPSRNTYMRFDNVVMAKKYIGPQTGTGIVSTPTISTPGGTYSNMIYVPVQAAPSDTVRYTTNGENPNYWSPMYKNPIRLVKNATFKVRAFRGTSPYSAVDSQTYIINTPGLTTVTKTPVADATLRDGTYKTTNNGTATVLELKPGSVSYDRRIVIKFSVSDIQSLSSATLRFYVSAVTGPLKLGLLGISPQWTAPGVTWNSAPLAGDAILPTLVLSETGWVEADVSNYVSAQSSTGATEVAFYLMGNNTEMDAKSASIVSSESSTNKPELIIVSATPVSTKQNKANIIGSGIRKSTRGRGFHIIETGASHLQESVKIYTMQGKLLYANKKAAGTSTGFTGKIGNGMYLIKTTVNTAVPVLMAHENSG